MLQPESTIEAEVCAIQNRMYDTSATDFEIRPYCSLDELESIRSDWNNLLANYPSATTFSTPEWLIPWWRNFGADQQLLVLGCYESSRLVGLAPLSLSKIRVGPLSFRRLRLMGDGSKDSDNLDFPVRPGFEDKFAELMLRFLVSNRNSWDFGEFNTMPPGSPLLGALRKLLREKNWIAIERHTPASAISLPETWEQYLQLISVKERGKIRYYRNRLEKKYQVRFYKCSAESDLPACLEALFHLHQERWQGAGQKGSFQLAARRQFYLETGRQLLRRGLLEFWLLDLDGVAVAAQFGFRYGNTVSQLQEGFDRSYSTDSVGFLLRAHVIRELISQGVRTYDFLGGQPGYKAKWEAVPGHYVDFQFARPLSAGAAYLRYRHYAGQSKAWLRRSLPKSAWQFLHRANVKLRGRKRP